MNDTTPIFNLKVVIKETGLSAATLRAWERRYGLIKPQRSPGGHRLYSRQDIDLLKWLIARQQVGLSISQAVGLWKLQQESAPRDLGMVATPNMISQTGEEILFELREQWVAACKAFDDLAANRALDQAFAIATPETVIVEILQKGLVQIGHEWYTGSVSVPQEHFASSIATRRLDALFTALSAPSRSETILVACPPGEEHDFILLMIAYLLRRKGWNVLYLGSNVPFDDLEQTIKSANPALVLSAAQTLTGAASLNEMSRYLGSLGVPLVYGGGIFSDFADSDHHIAGYYLGTDLSALPGVIELLVISPPVLPNAQTLSPEYAQTLSNYRRQESVILANVTASLDMAETEGKYIDMASGNLTRMLESALRLGDIHLLDHSVRWLDGLLSYRGIQSSLLKQFFHTYRLAVDRVLGEQGKLIIGWLENVESMIS